MTNHITVQAAAEYSGYSLQYIRRLLRSGKLVGLKIGQVWLIEKSAFEAYLEKANQATERRFGPEANPQKRLGLSKKNLGLTYLDG
ncbi:MAG: helix-turn-helix domain-containing protein [Anaerolineales bacterium]|nr:helix-turn-helix domain-containing protein [Anaerolineales bacterium]